ncbi:Flagellar motor rotation protein MotB [Liberibacter crescens BT-1]|uniref:Flagellar motor rotation protein MotB n=1 Tax=Liberibacter crescens (strain BT-1) TaxID=1215343 RepID=L0ETI0_LIBCB|nr:peptidoglycan -binding protein [Liberibacter crescens]AGA64849.1 Flagellar motor rotation protein MotB [Liberibacter crescens BT-1]AMC12898.1 hypothetical protein RL73_04335 [Liberibacter crescens]
MALSSRRRRSERVVDYWPGFVDALTTLLMAIMFLLTVFVVAQFILNREINGRDKVLSRLYSQIEELTQILSLERSEKHNIEDSLQNLRASLSESEGERSRLRQMLDSAQKGGASVENQPGAEKKKSINQIEILNQQIAALRAQIRAVEIALQASESKDKQNQGKISDLGRRLNIALAQRVQELNRYRSDFFGRLREILSKRDDIRVVGDRFVFQSEVLFPPGISDLNDAGKNEMNHLAVAVLELNKEIPPEINWVLRVDGHTDDTPFLSSNGKYADNWQLSVARAVSVVKYLLSKGVPAKRLVAAGFGEYQPLVEGFTPEARAANRRIELKLTER